MSNDQGGVSAMSAEFNGAWVAINAYSKLASQLAACKVAGHQIDHAELQELRLAKMSVDLELIKLMAPLNTTDDRPSVRSI